MCAQISSNRRCPFPFICSQSKINETTVFRVGPRLIQQISCQICRPCFPESLNKLVQYPSDGVIWMAGRLTHPHIRQGHRTAWAFTAEWASAALINTTPVLGTRSRGNRWIRTRGSQGRTGLRRPSRAGGRSDGRARYRSEGVDPLPLLQLAGPGQGRR